MKETAKSMMALLSAAVCGAGLADDVKTNMTAERLTKLYALSSHHDMAHLVGFSLDAAGLLGDGAVDEGFRRRQMLAIYREQGQSAALTQATELLENEGIDYLPLKGAVIRARYPEPWMRTGCDIDILVRREDLERAADSLCERLGYRREERNAHDLSLMSEEGVNLELHFDMIEADCAARSAEVLRDIWQYAHLSRGNHGYGLSDDMFYFYHIAHMAKHFEHGGCGVKPFLDLWLLCHGTEFDGEARRELLKKGGLLKFAEACEEVSSAWFSGGEWTETVDEISRYLLRAGTYGSTENKAAVGSAKRGKGKSLMSRIWMPYEVLKGRYPSLEGRRFLIFFYQVRRWSHILLRGRAKQSLEELKANTAVTEERSREAVALLSRLEL